MVAVVSWVLLEVRDIVLIVGNSELGGDDAGAHDDYC